MQPADDMEFGGAFAGALGSALVHFFKCKSVSARSSWIAPESAKFAMRHANVGGIDVAIDVVIGDVAVALFANIIGQPAHREKIGGLIQSDTVLKGEALASEYSIGDRFQACVGDG